MYEGADSDAQGVQVVPSASSRTKTIHLKDLIQPNENEVGAMVAHFKGWKLPALVVALAETGFVHRTKWSHGETQITEEDITRMNRCLARHVDCRISMNRNFIWFAKTTGSNPRS